MHTTQGLGSFGLIVGVIFASSACGQCCGVVSRHGCGTCPRQGVTGLGARLAALPGAGLSRGLTVGEVLGWMNTRLILGVLFYSLFPPSTAFRKFV